MANGIIHDDFKGMFAFLDILIHSAWKSKAKHAICLKLGI